MSNKNNRIPKMQDDDELGNASVDVMTVGKKYDKLDAVKSRRSTK
jgi:hypothetical protein